MEVRFDEIFSSTQMITERSLQYLFFLSYSVLFFFVKKKKRYIQGRWSPTTVLTGRF